MNFPIGLIIAIGAQNAFASGKMGRGDTDYFTDFFTVVFCYEIR